MIFIAADASAGRMSVADLTGAAVAAGAGYYFLSSDENALKVKAAAKEAEAKAKSAVGQGKEAASDVVTKKALTGGDQGFIGLVLDSVETYNHNTKKLRFKLPHLDFITLHCTSNVPVLTRIY